MRIGRDVAMLLSFLLWTPGLVWAQGTAPTNQEELARSISRQPRVKLRLDSGREIELRQPALVGDTVRGTPKEGGAPVELSFGEVHRVWRRGNAMGIGMATGAAVGAAAGAAAAVAMSSMSVGFGSGGQSAGGAIPVASLGGAVLGAMLGGFIGASIHRWTTIYQRPAATVSPVLGPGHVGLSVAFR